MLKKPVSEAKRYWCFPPLDKVSYTASLDHFTLFPDPATCAVGFIVTTGRVNDSQEPNQFLNTTTSYLSDDLSADSFRSTSPYTSREVRTEVKSITEKRPALRSYVPQQAPPCIPSSRTYHHSPGDRIIWTDRQREPSPMNRTFQSIEASIQRIRGCLSKCKPVLHALHSKSPQRKNTPSSPASRSREYTSVTGRFRSMEVGNLVRRSPRCSTERSQE